MSELFGGWMDYGWVDGWMGGDWMGRWRGGWVSG